MADAPQAKTAVAQKKLAKSAEKLVDSALVQEDSADRRTQLAGDRTLLASERTYAAWLRTGLAALAAGVGAKALLEELVAPWLVVTASIVLIVIAEFCFVAGVWRQLVGAVPPPRPDVSKLPEWLLVVLNGLLVILGGAVLIGIVTR